MHRLSHSSASLTYSLAIACAVLLGACGGGSAGNASGLASNEQEVVVDAGPPGVNAVNLPYTRVTVCQPGSVSNCQTIDHVLIDTGSTGLRLLRGALGSLNLPSRLDDQSRPLYSCAGFLDGSVMRGPVVSADVHLGHPQPGNLKAGNLPIQLIDAAESLNYPDQRCDAQLRNTVSSLHANGILGIGPSPLDCGNDCITATASPSLYFALTAGTTLVNIAVAPSDRLAHPVAQLPAHNNGVILTLDALSPGTGTNKVSGLLTLGIETASNNALGQARKLTLDPRGQFSTTVNGSTVLSGFLDSGSNGLFFDMPAGWQTCSPPNAAWYCTTSTLTVSNSDGTTTLSTPLHFADVTAALGGRPAAIGMLSGALPGGASGLFDFGLPFFFGRRIYIGINNGTEAFIAY